jgi:hypothetical protein
MNIAAGKVNEGTNIKKNADMGRMEMFKPVNASNKDDDHMKDGNGESSNKRNNLHEGMKQTT